MHALDWSIPRLSAGERCGTLESSVAGTMLKCFPPSRSLLSRRAVVWDRSGQGEWERGGGVFIGYGGEYRRVRLVVIRGRWIVVRDILVVARNGAKNNIGERTCRDGPSCIVCRSLNLVTLTWSSTTSCYIH